MAQHQMMPESSGSEASAPFQVDEVVFEDYDQHHVRLGAGLVEEMIRSVDKLSSSLMASQLPSDAEIKRMQSAMVALQQQLDEVQNPDPSLLAVDETDTGDILPPGDPPSSSPRNPSATNRVLVTQTNMSQLLEEAQAIRLSLQGIEAILLRFDRRAMERRERLPFLSP